MNDILNKLEDERKSLLERVRDKPSLAWHIVALEELIWRMDLEEIEIGLIKDFLEVMDKSTDINRLISVVLSTIQIDSEKVSITLKDCIDLEKKYLLNL